jgi:hypothetical protein
MIMIWHQAIRDHHHAILLIITLDQLQKVFIIASVEENPSLTRAAVVEMIVLALRESVTAIWHICSKNVLHIISSRRLALEPNVPKAGF